MPSTNATDRRFIRNGTEYDAGTAAHFLRAKWSYARDRIHTAEDFVREDRHPVLYHRELAIASADPMVGEEDGASFLLRRSRRPPIRPRRIEVR